MNKLKLIRGYVLIFLFGAIVSSLLLDNRAGALLKAFFNPVAVNGLEFKVEVKK